jgi:hypothetical protein
MIRIAFSTLFISLVCISCGTEKNESSSETLSGRAKSCQKERSACIKKKKKNKTDDTICQINYNSCISPGLLPGE